MDQHQQLRTIFSQALSDDKSLRTAAEGALKEARRQPGHTLGVLQIIAADAAPADVSVRLLAAVHFKNMIKGGWAPSDDDDEGNDKGGEGVGCSKFLIPEGDRATAKTHLVELMCTVPPQIRSQCSESIALIAVHDFPAKWDNLLPDLVARFTSSGDDVSVLQGVLLTVNELCKSFRYVQRSDDLYRVIMYVLNGAQEPLLKLFQRIDAAVNALAGASGSPDAAKMNPLLGILRTICRIFYSLNYQDLPEYFEDHMQEWMTVFAKYLKIRNHALSDESEETEPSALDGLRAAIVANLHLYADKDEEPFMPYVPEFAKLVWNLLTDTKEVGPLPKHDALAAASIRFLSGLVGKLMHSNLFKEEATLREIVGKIVVPNLVVREVDEERFEDDPQEFILGDMEGSDTESRRKCAQDLLRAMCRQFETETTGICLQLMGSMLVEYTSDPAGKWAAKDAAMHLMLGIAVKAESVTGGVSQVNKLVNVTEFFTTNVLLELQETNMSVRPMVKATAIKFISTFRNQFSKEQLSALMPLLIAHLGSGMVVLHTYAAAAIEKTLTAKVDGTNGTKIVKFGGTELKPFLNQLFTGLFAIVENTDWNENEYVMKCIMRALNVARDDLLDIVQVMLEKLTAALARVAKNPRNPHYNHFLFESIAILVRAVCSKDAAHTSAFENFVFPHFQTVLQMDISEFTPYVFQILAQILEFRPVDTGLGPAYTALLEPLLSPTLWERKGNIPALTRLLRAYLSKGSSEIVSKGQLLGILGVFQKLVSSKKNEPHAFDLLNAITTHVPKEALMPRIKDVFQILLTKLQQGKTPRFVGLLTIFFAFFIGMYGPQPYFDQLDAIQPGLGIMLLQQVWLPCLLSSPPTQRSEVKTQVVGITKLLCETNALLADASRLQIWCKALECVVKLVVSLDSRLSDALAVEGNDDDAEIGYDATFSRLHFANRPAADPFPEATDPGLALARSLNGLCASQPGKITPLIQQGLQSDPKLGVGLESMCQKAGVNLV